MIKRKIDWKKLPLRTRIQIIKKIEKNNFNEKQMIQTMNEEVFSNPDFKRHIIETSLRLKIPEKIIEEVVKHYLLKISLLMIKVEDFRRRINIYGFFHLLIVDRTKNKSSIYHSKKYNKNKN